MSLFHRKVSMLFWVLLLASSGCLCAEDSIDFVRDVRPIFERHCYACHGADKQKSGLRLDIRDAVFQGGDGYGPSVVAKDAEESPLVQLVSSGDAQERMPPEGDGLSAQEIDTLTQWIRQGAVWPDGVDRVQLKDKRDHWSFQPVIVTPGAHSIDSFVQAKLEEHGLSMSTEADRVSWLRRVSFDLVGLPPTPERVQAFVADRRSDAYQRVVDELLQSPRYGERWAQHWLDVVRYADTHGFEVNTERSNAWPYRDYVIRAFNQDTPYDRFIREQIVGDAMGENAATGFLVTASVLLSGQIGKDAASIRLARQDSLDEIVNNVGQTLLGLSIGCARCHDHKFDPISARDYYAMQAFVAGVEYADRRMSTPEAEAQFQAIEPLRRQLSQLDNQLAQFVPLAQPRSKHRANNLDGNEESNDSQSTKSELRPTLRPSLNTDRFHPVLAKRLRLTVLATNGLEPCLDEMEVFNEAGENVAHSSRGTKVRTSGDTIIADRHEPEFINDGQYGNSRSWLASELKGGWIELEFPGVETISRVTWSRDREGKLVDRNTTDYSIEVAVGDDWQVVADASDRRPVVAGIGAGPSFNRTGLSAEEADEADRLMKEKSKLEKKIKAAEEGQLVFAGKFRAPDKIHLLSRGDPEQPREEVFPAVLSSLGKVQLPSESPEQQRRSALADWIARPENPLTARVMVNRIWQGHFGNGIVQTPSDFGNNGALPTHPELLDWLAEQFVRSGWSIKHMHRLIVLSKTYRQRSDIPIELAEDHGANGDATTLATDKVDPLRIDADVKLLWRYPARRIDAEVLRDSMLAVSGQLNLTMYGRGYNLFSQRGGLSGFKPIESFSGDGLRRMIYAHKVRRESEAVFGAFDCPDAGQSAAVRRESTTPIQALNLFNSRFTLQQSDAFAQRVESETNGSTKKQIRRAYEVALLRVPDRAEMEEAESIVRQHGLATLCRALLNSNEFIFIP